MAVSPLARGPAEALLPESYAAWHPPRPKDHERRQVNVTSSSCSLGVRLGWAPRWIIGGPQRALLDSLGAENVRCHFVTKSSARC